MKKRNFVSLGILVLLLVAGFFGFNLVQKRQHYLSEALGQPANIVVNPSVNLGPMFPIWQALAQGGEESADMLKPVLPDIKALKPQYIRLDHLYDFYEVVSRENGSLRFDWSKLDPIVDSVLATGAQPFFSLSYMPPVIARNGQITEPPVNWNDWQEVVKATIEHFSGQGQRNLKDIHYEVWNEPDLFGNWKIGGNKDYRTLYFYAVQGAQQANNVNAFKIGGPSTTAPYQNWVDHFLDYVFKNNLRLDFYSWHRYSLKPQDFLDDVDRVDNWLRRQGGYSLLPKFLTEWGSNSENSPYHDNLFDAAHLVATVRQLVQRVELAFIFEIKDGPPPGSEEYWGRWGLLTYHGNKKPKYSALQLLNQIQGNRIRLDGEGTWVTGLAAKNKDQILLVLANLDPKNHHSENVPVTFVHLKKGQYSLEELRLNGSPLKTTETVDQDTLVRQIPMLANEVILLKLTKVLSSQP